MASKIAQRPPSEGARIKAHAAQSENFDKMRPVFCFEHMVSGYCVNSCTKDEKAHLADALFKRSQMTWAELRQAHKMGLGYEKISRNSLKKSVPTAIKEDVQIIAFRFAAKAPMVGFRDKEVFRVIWLDRAFDLYNH